jgi:hypothetical protein
VLLEFRMAMLGRAHEWGVTQSLPRH